MVNGRAVREHQHAVVRAGVCLGDVAVGDHLTDELGVGDYDVPAERFRPPVG
jgi:hypothetical protein